MRHDWHCVDARQIPSGDCLDADVCVVGAGPAGLAVTGVLTSHRRDVILLESGGERPEEASQSLGAGRLIGLDYFPLHEARQRGLGGTTSHWDIPLGAAGRGARLHPLSAADFSVREWVPHSGWPVRPAALDPYYRQASRLCGIEPVDTTSVVAAEPAAALPLSPAVAETMVFQAGSARQWRPQLLLGAVPRGCLRLLTHATAVEILAAGNAAAVTGLRVATSGGREFTVGARVVVLAAGGIENARLLLLSGRRRRGLGNERDQVGRYFMEHPWLVAGLLTPAPGALRDTGLYQVHRAGQRWIEGRIVLPEPVRRRERILGCGVRLRRLPGGDPLPAGLTARPPSGGEAATALIASALRRRTMPRDTARLLRALACDPAGLLAAIRGERAAAARVQADPPVFALEVMSEQAPNPGSRVLLDHRRRDQLGQPASRLDWRITSLDMETIVRTLSLIGDEFACRGLGTFHLPLHPDLPPVRLRGGRHHMGTTRMADDPARGVVDADCRVHGLTNLYVAGSSVFPTGGYANPTLTIVALALRLGAHLSDQVSHAGQVRDPRR